MGLAAKPTFLVVALQEDCDMQIASINEEKGCLVICAQILSSECSAVSKNKRTGLDVLQDLGLEWQRANLQSTCLS